MILRIVSMKSLCRVLICWVIICLAAGFGGLPARACYSGLVLIPTADVVENGGYSIDLQFNRAFAQNNEDTGIINTEYGLIPGLEAGVDYDLSNDAETRLFLNAKYVLSKENNHNTMVAVGITNVGQNISSNPYVVATQDLHSIRGHLGVVGIDGKARWFTGVDKAVNKKIMLMADYTNGGENSASVGVSYQFNERSSLTTGIVFPNAGGDTQFTLQYIFCGSFRKAK